MSFPNVTDIVATTIEKRSGKIADNVTKNNAVLSWVKENGGVKTVDGGSLIFEELNFAENGNFGWYSGYDLLPVAAQDVISAAQYTFKQCACPVVISGLEQLQNSGEEKIIDLLSGRLETAEATMANNMAAGVYSDGTGYGGKQLTGLQAAVATSPSSGTYGGIDRATWTFWRNQTQSNSGALTAATIYPTMNNLWYKLVRGMDKPDLILADNVGYGAYEGALQALQRFTAAESAKFGFATLKYKTADVVLDGGMGGFMPASQMYFLNTKHIKLRPHAKRNMVPLDPNKRVPVNQDAEIQIIAWAGNMTTSNASLQGVLTT